VPSFRLLDARTGWDVHAAENLTGFDDTAGLRLAGANAMPGAVHYSDLVAYLPPARAGWDRKGRVFAVARDRLRVLDPCTGQLSEAALPHDPVELTSASVGRGLLALADTGSGFIDLLDAGDLRLLLRVDVHGLVGGWPRLVALTPWSLVAVVTERPALVVLIGLDGIVRSRRELPEARAAAELGVLCSAVDPSADLVIALRVQPGWRHLLRLDRFTLDAEPVDLGRLRPRLSPGAEVTADDAEFWTVRTERGAAATFDPDGELVDPSTVGVVAPTARRFATSGRLATVPIDSGLDDCEWHRVRFEATQPAGTWVVLRAATTAGPADAVGPGGWQVITGVTEALIQRPPGRYLRLELELNGNGTATPAVRNVRADFDVATSLDLLPTVYREQPVAAEFTRRFLSLFDSSLEDLDDVIEQAPLLFHAGGYPDHAVGALARLVGIQPDPSWPPPRLRALLEQWPDIWPRLGTAAGLRRAVSAVYGIEVLVEELGQDRPWGTVHSARLGGVRLFGAARASLRLGTGRLGEARLDPRADPLAPAVGSGAFRCVVHAPSSVPVGERRGLEALVRAFVPSHIAVRVRYAVPVLTVGQPLRVGIDTRVGGLPTGVLGNRAQRAVVLRRRGPLARGGGGTVTLQRRLVVGITSTAR
jgi:phage tail-like protein